jgi:hypothetical protein
MRLRLDMHVIVTPAFGSRTGVFPNNFGLMSHALS